MKKLLLLIVSLGFGVVNQPAQASVVQPVTAGARFHPLTAIPMVIALGYSLYDAYRYQQEGLHFNYLAENDEITENGKKKVTSSGPVHVPAAAFTLAFAAKRFAGCSINPWVTVGMSLASYAAVPVAAGSATLLFGGAGLLCSGVSSGVKWLYGKTSDAVKSVTEAYKELPWLARKVLPYAGTVLALGAMDYFLGGAQKAPAVVVNVK